MSALTSYLRASFISLVGQYDILAAEKAALQQAAARIPQINADQQTLIAEAQDIIDRYNADQGTSLTLQQARKALTALGQAQ